MFVAVGTVEETDITRLLNSHIQTETEAAGLSDLQLGEFGDVTPTEEPRFTQFLGVPYTATMSTQQGTMPITGVFAELLNPSTGLSAFINYFAGNQTDLDANMPDADKMLSSMM